MPPNKEGAILFGWEEKNDLPKDKVLVIARSSRDGAVETSIATKEDYILYYKAITGFGPEDFQNNMDKVSAESMKIDFDFAVMMGKFLTDEVGFSWKDSECYIVPDVVT
jgi:hypothetical protein